MGKTYWFVPFQPTDPPVLGGKHLESREEDCRELLRFLARIHPRLLIPFKASLLLQTEGKAECSLTFSLPSHNVVLDGKPFALSPCAKQWLSRLIPPPEARKMLQEAEEFELWDRDPLCRQITRWWQAEYYVLALMNDHRGDSLAIDGCSF
ncbi:hypothetical protein ACFO25_05645 [Paenactinomyces guangxiensis]|uniref:Uncharacterized protein n=1 Tax=Paenactinomyces guangxiensis TaxID=1490290 RepID=A0A7W2A8W5_9BACL|nr:hypothetical protein [Paenactinomyces guangxiensis]MBA4494283.1 hypothetical protein [Paenactinomyces guangxiensis]MBH8590777.1 hypothetical protein [Paenactinomyces guangxiensis]